MTKKIGIQDDAEPSRRTFLKHMAAAATVSTVGIATGFTGQKVLDAVEPAAEEITMHEWLQRSTVAKELLHEAAQDSHQLAVAFADFFYALGEKVNSFSGAYALAGSIWQGLTRDARDYLLSDDKNLDSTIDMVSNFIESDAILKRKWGEIAALITKMKGYEERFDGLADKMVKVDSADAKEAWEIYKKHFWEEVQKPLSHSSVD